MNAPGSVARAGEDDAGARDADARDADARDADARDARAHDADASPVDDVEIRIGRFLAGQPVLTAQAHAQIRTAFALLQQARDEAAALRARAEADAARQRADAAGAVQQAREQGWQHGADEARRAGAEQLLRSAAAQAHRWPALDERIARLVTRTVQRVLSGREHEQRFYESVVARAQRDARNETFVRMRVPLAQLDAARTAVQAVLARAGAAAFIDVVGDDALDAGACLLESADGVVDAGLDTQLDALRAALAEAWRAVEAGDGRRAAERTDG